MTSNFLGPSGIPNVGDTAVWNGTVWIASSNFPLRTDYYIADYGNDNNIGSEAEPLRSGAGLSQRIMGKTLTNHVTVHYLTDMDVDDYLIGPLGALPGINFNVIGENLESVFTGVLTGVTTRSATVGTGGTRPAIAIAGAPNWGANLIGKQFITQDGVKAYLDIVDPLDNTRYYISCPSADNTDPTTINIGDTINFYEKRFIGRNLIYSPITREAYDFSFITGTVQNIRVQDKSSTEYGVVNVGSRWQVHDCELLTFNLNICNDATIYNCNYSSLINAGQINIENSGWSYFGLNKRRLFLTGPGRYVLIGTTCSGGRQEISNNLQLYTLSAPSWWDWPAGAALEIEATCYLSQRGSASQKIFGSSSIANTYGILLMSGANADVEGNNKPNLAGTQGTGGSGTRDVVVAGNNFLYATAYPWRSTNNNAEFVQASGL